MAVIKTKTGTIAATALLTIPFVVLWMQNRDLRREIAFLHEAATDSGARSEVSWPEGMALIDRGELDSLRSKHRELLRLRGRVATLTHELNDLKSGRERAEAKPAEKMKSQGLDSVLFTAALTNRVKNGFTLVAGGWFNDGMRRYLLITPTIVDVDGAITEDPLLLKSRVVVAPEDFWKRIGWQAASSETRRSALCGVLAPEETETLLALLGESKFAEISNESEATRREGEFLGLGYCIDDENDEAGMMMLIDLYPHLIRDLDEVEIQLRPSFVPANARLHSSLK